MITQDYDVTNFDHNLLRQIEIKENQIKIAQKFEMRYVAKALQIQLKNLQNQLSDAADPQFEALMSLVDDSDL